MHRPHKLLVAFFAAALVWLLVHQWTPPLLQLEDALFLTKNLIREFHKGFLCRHHIFCKKPQQRAMQPDDLDIDYQFNNVVNSVFPIDSVVSYNASGFVHLFEARYASFSPVLMDPMVSEYAIFHGDACEPIKETSEALQNKTLVVLRGECKFVKKVENLLLSPLTPSAVIVANNMPARSLITMYSSTFNQDGQLRTPVLFMRYEDFLGLQEFQHLNLKLTIRTAAFDNWINLLLLVAALPPLLILLCYLFIRALQMFRRKRVNVMNEKLVNGLPVYIYNGNHLVPAKHFYAYLTATRQTDQVASRQSSENSSPEPESIENTSLVVNGTDLYLLRKLCGLLFAKEDFFSTFKCPICLERFGCLKLRVLRLDCHHIFHESCLVNWLINFKTTCPLCNENLRHPEHLRLLADRHASYLATGPADSEAEVGLNSDNPSNSANSASQAPPSDHISVAAVHSLPIISEPSVAEIRPHIASPPSSQSSTNTELSFVTTRAQPSSYTDYYTPRMNHSQAELDETDMESSSVGTLRI